MHPVFSFSRVEFNLVKSCKHKVTDFQSDYVGHVGGYKCTCRLYVRHVNINNKINNTTNWVCYNSDDVKTKDAAFFKNMAKLEKGILYTQPS